MIESVRALERVKSARPPHLVIYRLSLFRLVAASFAHRFPRLGLPDGVICVQYSVVFHYLSLLMHLWCGAHVPPSGPGDVPEGSADGD